MDYKKLDRKAIKSWRVGRFIGFAVALLICGGVCLGSGFIEAIEGYRWMIYVLSGVVVAYRLVSVLVYPLIEYRQWGYRITEDRVDIRHGIFFVTNTTIPIIRIQHITMEQGPVNRRFGLYDVEISLASGEFEIECLSKEVADEIVEMLKAKLYVRLEARGEELS